MSDAAQNFAIGPSCSEAPVESNGRVSPAHDLPVLDAFQPDKEVPIRGKDDVVRIYLIREMSDKDYAWVMSRTNERFRVNRKGVVVKADAEGMQAETISRCLYDKETGARVPKAMIDSWGLKVKNKLYAMCEEHNGLNRAAEEDEGKDSAAGGLTGGG